jgi:hypothetical protein
MADFVVLFAAYINSSVEAYVRASDGRAIQPQVWLVFRDCIVQVGTIGCRIQDDYLCAGYHQHLCRICSASLTRCIRGLYTTKV